MSKVDKGVAIGEWTRKYGYLKNIAGILADKNGLTSAAIYQYIKQSDEGLRDIRVIGTEKNPEIYEVRRLGK